MPWVRIDENAMDHPKFVAISANAWRLWCEGMTYCQKHLTDGFIPTQGAKGMRYYSPASLGLLLAVLVPNKGPLWHGTEGGYQVHDYHDWNDSREHVLEKRLQAKDRMDRIRGRSREQTSEQPSERLLSTPLHSPSRPRSNERVQSAEGFDAFWTVYPKKKSKADAEKAWRKLAPSPELSQRIQASIAAQLGSEDWRKEGGKFIPYPASWLNGRRWEDEVAVRAELPAKRECPHTPPCHSPVWCDVVSARARGIA